MVTVSYSPALQKIIEKMKDSSQKLQLKKLIVKIIRNPDVGKPMRYSRKGTREVYIGSYRLSYIHFAEKDEIVFLDLYHKDGQ
ncbi:MAG: type II toxin-antitoxin system RelE/ParE family toxin [Candidatus Aenigmarchaeota archaeon]|nr:type II toxin-antitoxin system RelE/ParE family toxin [Candidatus Aenigmarchaeota archaeon]